MALPISIDALLRADTIESERIELKKDWDPEDILHTMCAFANDRSNWGGGYIIIGVEEDEGQAVLPPKGLMSSQIDSLQKRVIAIGHKITPTYIPVISPYTVSSRQILVLWCPAGDNRPYSAPISLSEKRSDRSFYIRTGSETKKANVEQQRHLYELAQRIPFDDRINHSASVDNFNLGLIREYLREVGSDLYTSSEKMTIEDLSSSMLIAKRSGEYILPLNVGLLFFTDLPEKSLPCARIELVIHSNYHTKVFDEVTFSGPLHHQLRDVLSYIKRTVIRERVVKRPNVAEAIRYYNYPFAAIEEVLANAVYHKSYEKREPIEVQLWPDRIEVLSFPGPIPPVTRKSLLELPTHRRIIAREYRNRRVGDFLKELKLTEGRGTGIPTIYEELEKNGSPTPKFETDEDLTYFLVTLYCRKDMVEISSSESLWAEEPSDDHNITNLNDPSLPNNSSSLPNNGSSLPNNSSSLPNNGSSLPNSEELLVDGLPIELIDLLQIVGKRSKPAITRMLILRLCSHKEFSATALAKILGKGENYLRYSFLSPMTQEGWLSYTIPHSPSHPAQAYRTTEKGKKMIEEYDL